MLDEVGKINQSVTLLFYTPRLSHISGQITIKNKGVSMKKILALLTLSILSNIALADTTEEPTYGFVPGMTDKGAYIPWMSCDSLEGLSIEIKYFHTSIKLVMTDNNGVETTYLLTPREGFPQYYDSKGGRYTLASATGNSKLYSWKSHTNAKCR